MRNVSIIWTEKLELWYKQHFVENKTDSAAYLRSAVNFFVAQVFKMNF